MVLRAFRGGLINLFFFLLFKPHEYSRGSPHVIKVFGTGISAANWCRHKVQCHMTLTLSNSNSSSPQIPLSNDDDKVIKQGCHTIMTSNHLSTSLSTLFVGSQQGRVTNCDHVIVGPCTSQKQCWVSRSLSHDCGDAVMARIWGLLTIGTHSVSLQVWTLTERMVVYCWKNIQQQNTFSPVFPPLFQFRHSTI